MPNTSAQTIQVEVFIERRAVEIDPGQAFIWHNQGSSQAWSALSLANNILRTSSSETKTKKWEKESFIDLFVCLFIYFFIDVFAYQYFTVIFHLQDGG